MSKRKRRKKRRKARKAMKATVIQPPRVPSSVKSAEPPNTQPSGRFGWVIALAIATIATLAATAVTTFTPLFTTELEIDVSTRPHLLWSESNVNWEEARDVLKMRFCVKNNGLKPGAVARAVPGPTGVAKIPVVKVLSIDPTPIGFFRKKTVEVAVLLEGEVQRVYGNYQFKVDLYDGSDRWFGALIVDSKFIPQKPEKNVARASVTVEVDPVEVC